MTSEIVAQQVRSRPLRVLSALSLGAAASLGSGAPGCAAEAPPAPEAPTDRAYWENSPPVCAVDEVREYYCSELLPLHSARPAPEPYSNCPGQIEGHQGELDPRPTVAAFDVSYTEHIRRRMPPGHTCCYSWCAQVPLADASQIDPEAHCGDVRVMRESYCLDTPERGTTDPGPAPFQRCPRAIAPPQKVVFFAPPGALLDAAVTAQSSQSGEAKCCYSWCSPVPPGSGLPED
jgi:hypothetical protein